MKASDIQVGSVYLTGTVRRVRGSTVTDPTRGSVRVIEKLPQGRFRVEWLMRDGSPRPARSLPQVLHCRKIVAHVR